MQAKVSKWLGVAGSSNIGDNWQDILHSCLSDFKINRSFKRNSWQCTHIAHYLHRTAFVRRFIRDKQSILFVKCESAIKELCRAILEAKLFLQDCSTSDFWKNTNSVSNLHTGEAYDVLLHDLIWSTAALNLAICQITDSGDFQEIIQQIKSCIWDLSCCRQTGLHLDRADFYRSLQNRPRLYYDRSRKKHLTFLAQKSKACEGEGAIVQHLDVFEIDPGDLGQRKFLGAGGHGDVYRSSCFGQTVAVKVFTRASEDDFKNEASLLAGLQNPFIVNMVGWCKKNYECMLVMELAQTDLGKVIKQISSGQQPALSWVAAVDMMLQISKGMEYLHSRRIMHRDIKPNNVLLEPSSVKEFAAQGHARVKLCDFGLAKVKQLSAEDRSRYTTLNMGTSYYRAPEVLEDDEADIKSKYTRKADVFSFAITCSEILAGSFTTCYQKLTRKAMREKMLANVRPSLPIHCPSHLRDLISSCWDTDPGCRPPFRRIRNTLIYIKLIVMRVSDAVMYDSVVTPFDEDELKRRILEDEESESGGSRSGSSSREMAAGDNLFVTIPFDDNSERQSTDSEQVKNWSGPDIQAHGARREKFELYDEGLANYAYEDIVHHAGYFDTAHVIGKGRFATAYRSHLPDGTELALKILRYSTSQATFDQIIAMLASIQHNHILPIKGYYSSPVEKALVYEYFPRGTLYDLLHGEDAPRLGSYSPVWATRQMIAVGVAQALDYLHHRSVLHMDVKSTNILLERGLSDHQLLPKLADFGIVRLVSGTCSGDVVWRDQGYTAPEVLRSRKSTKKSDVYSFGVVLLELITGKKPIRWVEGKKLLLCSWVEEVRREKGEREIMDAVALKTTPYPEYLDRALNLALLCVNENPNLRPSMSEVAQVIEGFASDPVSQLADDLETVKPSMLTR